MTESKICDACDGTGSVPANHPAIPEDKLREMVRQMVAEALAKPSETQPVEDTIVNITCEICEENYVGLLSNLRQGWYGVVEQGTWKNQRHAKSTPFAQKSI